jgi:hypothetical protein
MRDNLRWPLPALLTWGMSWALFLMLQKLAWPALAQLALPTCLGAVLSLAGNSWWRRLMIGCGFPVSLAVSGLLVAPPWLWLLPLLLLLGLYPLKAWRDAPLFPTPEDALNDLPEVAKLAPGARVLDAGCGLGHGLQALRQAYPLAELHGIEWSRPLRWWCARRCPWAKVVQGDIWQEDWSGYALVYLFQRPESMPGAAAKALKEMRPGSWLVSLEFEALELSAHARIEGDDKPVWVYKIPGAKTG